MTTQVEVLAIELRELLSGHHPVTGDNIALHTAEETGECIGAYNKLTQGRGTVEHFAQEWAQATLMLTMLGQYFLNEQDMAAALSTEMDTQRDRWKLKEIRD